MLKRILTGLVGAVVLVLILLTDRIWLPLGMMAVSIVAMWEFYRAVGLTSKNKPLCIIGIIGSCLIIGVHLLNSEYFMLIAFIYIVALLVIMLINHKNITISDVAMILVGNVYVSYLMLHIVLVRNMEFVGGLFVWLIFIGAFATDTFAYFVGVTLGRHKLCPDISPKKTIEGAIGGIIGCGLCFMLYGTILQQFFTLPDRMYVNMPLMFALGLICSVAAQIGDLVASIIKRQYGVKDFGKLLPGHGGILDRFDSILFVAPVVYLFITHIGVLGVSL